MMLQMHNPAHPGEVLREWLDGVSVTTAATHMGVTRAHLSRILNGHAGITADMALRLSRALNTSPETWLQMQLNYELWMAKQKPMPEVEPIKIPETA